MSLPYVSIKVPDAAVDALEDTEIEINGKKHTIAGFAGSDGGFTTLRAFPHRKPRGPNKAKEVTPEAK